MMFISWLLIQVKQMIFLDLLLLLMFYFLYSLISKFNKPSKETLFLIILLLLISLLIWLVIKGTDHSSLYASGIITGLITVGAMLFVDMQNKERWKNELYNKIEAESWLSLREATYDIRELLRELDCRAFNINGVYDCQEELYSYNNKTINRSYFVSEPNVDSNSKETTKFYEDCKCLRHFYASFEKAKIYFKDDEKSKITDLKNAIEALEAKLIIVQVHLSNNLHKEARTELIKSMKEALELKEQVDNIKVDLDFKITPS